MKKLNKIAIVSALLISFVGILLVYTEHNPNETIIIKKTKHEGYSFKTQDGISGFLYPHYEITVVNAFRIKTISVNKNEWELVDVWQKYNTKHPLKMYY